MIIGVPKEIKNSENRVGMTPAGVAELVKKGHTVYVQATAGANSGFSDDDYIAAGAKTQPAIENVYAIADMIVKVKEPIAPEYKLIRKGQVVFTYFHFAADKLLTEAMIESGAVCIAYETIEKADHSLLLLTPMSEVAGRMAVQVGARFLEKPQGGKGKLMGSVPGVRPARVLILGGCFETSHPTTHSEPTYVVDGIVHYAVANIPGAVPFTSTMTLTNATFPYTVALASKGWRQACKDDPALASGLNIVEGKVTYKAVADVFGMKFEEA